VSYSVTIKPGLKDVSLPGGIIGQGGQTYVLTDEQYFMLSPTASAALFSNVTQIGGSAAGTFDPVNYGAKGDGKIVLDGAITAGSTTLTCATSTPFDATKDVGKYVMVKGAGALGITTHIAQINSVTDSGHAVLSIAAPVTVVSGGMVLFATDDTVAFQAAIDAAVAAGIAGSYSGKVAIPLSPGRFWGIAGPLKTGGLTKGNSQLTLPVFAATGPKFTLEIEGPVPGSGVQHWQQLGPQTTGATLVSFFVHASAPAQVTSINNNGNSAVIGGPSQPGGYGVAPGVFSNMHLSVRNLSILTTHSAYGLTLTSMDLSGLANASIKSFAYGTAGSVTGTDYQNPGVFATGLSIGLLMPANGNNDLCVVQDVTCHGGYTYAMFATEHFDGNNIRILYCWAAFCPVGSYYSSVGSTHAIVATLLSIEVCTYLVYVIGSGSGGVGPFLHLRIDTETSTPKFGDNNGGTGLANARGDVVLTGLYTAANITPDNPVGFDIVDGQKSYPAISVAANYAVKTADEVVLVDCTAAARTVTLPTAVGRNRRIVLVKIDASANNLVVATTSSQTVNGAAPAAITTQWASREYFPASGNWIAR
jgi:hypothetical protein